MADLVSDVLLSFFCCCFYPPGGHHDMRHHHGHPAGRNSVHRHHHGAAGRTVASRSRPTLSLQTVELKVRMCCDGCERAVMQSLVNLRGVDSVEVDAGTGRVRVTGYVERGKVLREVRRRSGKKAEFWPSGGTPLRFASPGGCFGGGGGEPYRDSYSYQRRGYGDGGDRHGRTRRPARGGDAVSNMFNDDDVNACAIM
ncbi:heavy metal-associated isoprenylated plant protein 44-like [Hordeum vulgare subsp. vulgare]|uniref:HMA domain-containing protein n=1 Tax=Hordeum vulgare subsp. vulgare TaxID=112509 RepID=A0A8I6WGE6_HORVV|nr:heavy metal-associated isoprenylated plant protein 44-like [Hordeum vulgare subsp. vulgare]KAI5017772.1 hypothetical protein ZWY2020_042660 [Hordeum vulgare]